MSYMECGHDVRDIDCPFCCAVLASDPFAGLDVPFTDGSNS